MVEGFRKALAGWVSIAGPQCEELGGRSSGTSW